MRCFRWTCELLLAAFAGAAMPAFAIPLPLPFVLGEMNFNLETTRTTLNGFGTLEHSLASHGTLSVQASGTPLPTLTASAALSPVGTGSGRTDGLIRYSFEITGPAGIMVPVFVDASGRVAGFADAGAAFAAEARWSLRNTSEINLVADTVSVSTSNGDTDPRSFAASHLVMLQTNTEYRVVMEAIAQAGMLDVGLHATAEAFIDPLFRFAEGVDLSLFGFHFADGIGNQLPDEGGGGDGGGTVPEPGALANVALALGLLALRRRNGFSRSGGAGSVLAG